MSIPYKSYNTINYIFTVWRNNAPLKTIEAYDAGTITSDVDSELKTSYHGIFWEYSEINFVSDQLRIDCEINGKTYPLGVFCVTTETPYAANGLQLIEIEAYSLLWILQQCRIENRVTYAKGESYVSIIQGLMQSAGLINFEIEASDLTLATDREDWDIGTDYLTIINDLLDEINYNELYVDTDGKIRAKKYVAPAVSGVTHIYSEGENSIISADYRLTNDRFGRANVFIVICDNPELAETLRAESVNDDISSPYSVTNLGRRVASITYVDNTPSADELQNYADKLNAQSKQTNEVIEFSTAIQPDHTPYEILMVLVGGASGVYRETGYEISMGAGGQMKHTALRVIV